MEHPRVFDPRIEAGLTIAWGKYKNQWSNGGKHGRTGSPGDFSGALEYPVTEEGLEMSESSGPQEKTVYVTLTGLPLTMEFEWPFHRSTSGADFWVLHAQVRVEGTEDLRAPLAVNMSATVRELFPSLEPQDTQGPVINAVRKEVDRRQLEFVKSGKLVPLHFSSRHYDFKKQQWAFGKASEEEIRTFLERKVYWQTAVVGGDVWIGDETEAQYLQTSAEHLAQVANEMAREGLFRLERRYATALPPLMARAEKFESVMRGALTELERKHAFERG